MRVLVHGASRFVTDSQEPLEFFSTLLGTLEHFQGDLP